MLKVMTFGEKDVQFSTSFAWAFVYKSQFGEDPVKSLLPTIRSILGDPEIEKIENENEKEQAQVFALLDALGFTGVAQIAWAMAKLADNSIPAPLAWVTSFGDDFLVIDIVSELITEAITSCFATKKSTAPIPADTEPKKTK